MSYNSIKAVVLVTLLSVVGWAMAQSIPDPIKELQAISDTMIKSLKQHRSSMKKNPQEVYDIVRKELLPHADLNAMARAALGRTVWNAATPSEKKEFIVAFTQLMLQTYAAGLSSYTDEKVIFEAIRGGIAPNQTRVQVNSKILRTDGPAISVSYRLVYESLPGTAVKDWYVYDFSVEGISMIGSFHSQFAAELANKMTLPQLTQKLLKHNGSV